MQKCPYRFQYCSAYFGLMQRLSDELAGTIQDYYCNDNCRACRRREAIEDGTLRSDPNLSPWASPRTRLTSEYV